MQMKKIIKSGTLVTASETFNADILIDGEVISSVAENIQLPGVEIIEAGGKFILPGGIDPHTHFDLPSH
jgi:dihydropyrimidinase